MAESFNRSVSTSELFSLNEKLTGFGVGHEFNKAAFDLKGTPEEYFSEPIIGKSSVYVLAFNRREDARVPAFEEVKAKAIRAATEDARERLLATRAREIRSAVEQAIKQGKSFEDAVKPFGLKTTKTKPFTAFEAPEAISSPSVLEAIVTRKEHELTGLLMTERQALIAYVLERKPGDDSTVESLRPQMIANLNKRASRLAFREWQQAAAKNAHIQEQDATAVSDEGAPAPAPASDDWDW